MARPCVILPCIFILITFTTATAYKRVCYYTNWSQYRPRIGRYTADNIDPDLCSHIIIAFAKLDGNVLKTLEWNDETTYKKINALKQGSKDLKTLIAVGGWNAGSKGFSNMASTKSNRRTFINSAVGFLKRYKFDGLDLDWEYPAQREGVPADKENFALLVKELKAVFKNRFLLTAAVPIGKSNIDKGYKVSEIVRSLDFINLMAYDIHGSWESITGQNAPLNARSGESNPQLNVKWGANYWLSKGVPADKLIIGLATYGRSFTLQSTSQYGIGAPAAGPGKAGEFTRKAGFLSYYEICRMQGYGQTYWDTEQQVPYYVNGKLWVGFDNVKSIRVKTEWIKKEGFGGAMIWSLALDDFNKICDPSGRRYPLLSTINDILNGGHNGTTASTSTSGSSTTTGSTTTSTTSTTTTHGAGRFSCEDRKDGLYPDPKSPHDFYQCSNHIAYHMKCPGGLIFDPDTKVCRWPNYASWL